MKPLVFFFVSTLVMISSGVFAQHTDSSGECTFGIVVEDPSCGSGTGCKVETFTVPCDQSDYCFKCGITCTQGSPYNCKVTATLHRANDSFLIATCANWGEENCGGSTDCNYVSLQAGFQYRLTVCLEACHQCSDCEYCNAWARVQHN